jgi:hypothetical protein
MSGTSGSFIVHEINQLDGYVIPITAGGSISVPFVAITSSISVHNVSNDFKEVIVNTIIPATGNQRFILAPNSAQSISNSPEAVISSVDVNDLGLLGNGAGYIVVNSFFK